MRFTHTVGGRLAFEVPSLHCTLESLSFADSSHVNVLAWNKVTGVYLRKFGNQPFFIRDTKFPYQVGWVFILALQEILVLPHDKGGDILSFSSTGTNFDCHVAVLVHCLMIKHFIFVNKQNCAGVAIAPIIKEWHHTDLDSKRSTTPVPQRPASRQSGVIFVQEILNVIGPYALASPHSRLPIWNEFLAFFFFLHFLDLFEKFCCIFVRPIVRKIHSLYVGDLRWVRHVLNLDGVFLIFRFVSISILGHVKCRSAVLAALTMMLLMMSPVINCYPGYSISASYSGARLDCIIRQLSGGLQRQSPREQKRFTSRCTEHGSST
mmetsp:Transcript_14183/g.39256  ORF Transcript_14183/g.39256 Transcript_14183/m.39256 type:complete len:321 (+) Transcript_14183:490-1452(+)